MDSSGDGVRVKSTGFLACDFWKLIIIAVCWQNGYYSWLSNIKARQKEGINVKRKGI